MTSLRLVWAKIKNEILEGGYSAWNSRNYSGRVLLRHLGTLLQQLYAEKKHFVLNSTPKSDWKQGDFALRVFNEKPWEAS